MSEQLSSIEIRNIAFEIAHTDERGGYFFEPEDLDKFVAEILAAQQQAEPVADRLGGECPDCGNVGLALCEVLTDRQGGEALEIVGHLLLGGPVDQDELEDNDIDLDMKIVERLQSELVTKGEGVILALMTVAQHSRIVAEKDAELKKVKADRSACWAEFKVMTRSCLDAEKEREQLRDELEQLRALLGQS